MSRSYKYPIFKDNDGAGKKKSWKTIFNRKLRRNKKYFDIPDGNSYKKINDSWIICDYKFRYSEESSTPPWKAKMK